MEQASASSAVVLGQYKGLPVTRHVRAVSERAVELELKHQARIHGVYAPSSEPARPGSRVRLDFEGFLDGEPIPDSQMDGVEAVLGAGTLMPAAEQAVCGHCAGEEFRFDFTYPADFRVQELAGQTAQFEIRLHSVEEKQAAGEPDDALARLLGYASLDAMREGIRQKKAAVHEANADRKAGAELLAMAGANLTVELPAAAVDRLAAQQQAQLNARLQRSGVTLAQHCARNHTTPEALAAQFKQNAIGRLRSVLAAQAIAQKEGITVSNEEVDEEIRRLSELHGTPVEEIRKVLAREAIAASIAARKVQQFLLANAVVTTITDSAPQRSAHKE